MKIKNQKYTLSLSLLGCLLIGFVVEKNVISWVMPSTISVHALSMARDIGVYTQYANAIVEGEVTDVGQPYFLEGTQMIQRDVTVTVDEALKGDSDMEDVTVVMQGGQIDRKTVLSEDEARLFPREKVLLFLGTNNMGDYVVFAGPNGAYKIDDEGNVNSAGGFEMPLDELKAKIKNTLLVKGDGVIPPAENAELFGNP